MSVETVIPVAAYRRVRTINPAYTPGDFPSALPVEVGERTILEVGIATGDVRPFYIVLVRTITATALQLLVPIVDVEQDLSAKNWRQFGILDSKNDVHNACGCIGFVLRKNEIHFQHAGRGV